MNICAIGGTGRSGTSLLYRIMTRHPDVSSIPEFRFTIDPDGLLDFYTGMCENWSPYCFDFKLRRLTKLLHDLDRPCPVSSILRRAFMHYGFHGLLPFVPWSRYSTLRISDHSPGYRKCVTQLIADLREFQFKGQWVGMPLASRTCISYSRPLEKKKLASILGGFYLDVASDALKKQRGSCFLEKNTWNILFFHKFLELVPEAKLVHIYRDPRDVVASMTKQSWAPSDPCHASEYVRDILLRWFSLRSNLPDQSYLELRFEELISDPESNLRKICSFWQMDWNNGLLSENLSAHHMGRWQKQFNKQTKAKVVEILKPVIDAYGYSI